MRRTRFVIDYLSSQEFEGYTRGEDWNGFAYPYFTFDQAQRLVKAWQEQRQKAHYDEANNQFNFVMEDGEIDSFPPVGIDGGLECTPN
jgi:hypothetical protein